MSLYSKFHIHGDNIVECERAFALIRKALFDKIQSVSGPLGTPVCPNFVLNLTNGQSLSFTYFPGYGRWNNDILNEIKLRGGTLREAADVILTGVTSDSEHPLLAIEYCGALPAGNQAWQRNGRAYSFGMAQIPYLYVAELGGFELDESRNRKASRMPNAAVPFSYLAYSLERGIPILPVFVSSPGADDISRKDHSDVFADAELMALTRSIILNEDGDQQDEKLRKKVLSFVKKRSEQSKRNTGLTARQWTEAYEQIKQGLPMPDFLIKNTPLKWSKTAYIKDLTPSAKEAMQIASNISIGLTSSDLPMCIIPANQRDAYSKQVMSLYKNLPQSFMEWLSRKEHLAICWVMGFKPKGDDARPDRGLPPLTRMLVGENVDIMTVIYGPAPASTWPLLRDNPTALMEKNGLWESILTVSDAILIDAITDDVTRHGFTRSHWIKDRKISKGRLKPVIPQPVRIGENDVDTVLHRLFVHHGGHNCFEGMCNPPGGDWSGISLQPPNQTCELRWLSLPRVSGNSTKRPDHVFQIFDLADRPIILSIESKETARSVENSIGPRLSAYVKSLIKSPPSIERQNDDQPWFHSNKHLNQSDYIFCSGVAFICDNESQLASVVAKSSTDIVFAFKFDKRGAICTIKLVPCSSKGSKLVEFIAGIDTEGSGITIEI